MFQLIEEWSSTLPKWEVLEQLNAHNIPCGPILSTKEIIEDASLVANEMVVDGRRTPSAATSRPSAAR